MRFSLLLFLLVAGSEPLYAQEHFTDCTHRTGRSATLIIPAAATLQVGGASIAAGDEIAAFTPGGTCAGVVIWKGRSVALTLWGRDAVSNSSGGLAPGDLLQVRIWDASEQTTYHEDNSRLQLTLRTDAPHLHTSLYYAPGAIYVVERLSATLTSQARR